MAGAHQITTCFLVIALVIGCKDRRRPVEEPPQVVEDAAPEDDADSTAIEVADAIAAGDLEVTLEQVSGPLESGQAIYLNRIVTQETLVVRNLSDEPMRAALPRYFFAHLPGYAYPYGNEGCLPEDQYLVAVAEEEVAVAPGDRVVLRVEQLEYLGNVQRPPPNAGSMSIFAVKPAPDDHRLVRLATALADAKELGGLAFAIAGGCTPEPWITTVMLEHQPVVETARIEAALRAADFDPSISPGFAAARRKREEEIARLTTELEVFLKTRDITGLAIMYAHSNLTFLKFFTGDAEVAGLAARYLEPDASGRRPNLVHMLVRLGVASPPVLEALDRAAAEDADAGTRADAAAAAAKLRAPPP